MAFDEERRAGKGQTTGDQIAPGAIELRHLSKGLFAEFRKLGIHNHSGVNSVQIKCQDLDGSFNKIGIPIRSPNGTVWHIKVDNSGVITAS